MGDFDVYLESLVGSWELLTAPHPDALLLRTAGFVASICPSHPVFNNALLFQPAAAAEVPALFARAGSFAVWSRKEVTACALRDLGFRAGERTRPMVCHLEERPPVDLSALPVVREVPAEQIAALNGLSGDLLAGVSGARGFATQDVEAGAILLGVGSDANVSFVATRPEHRRRGLARAVLVVALDQARRTGYRTSSLQSTDMAEHLYRSLGYQPLDQWQEWVRP